MAGKIKVQGDMTKLMAMQSGPPDPAAAGGRQADRRDHRVASGSPTPGSTCGRGGSRPLLRALAAFLGQRGVELHEEWRRRRRGRRRPRRRGRPRRRRRRRRPCRARAACTVCITWMPITTPTWLTICWVAPAMPRSRSSTALAMAAAMAGDDAPMPSPDRARAPTTTQVAVARREGGEADHRRRDRRRPEDGRRTARRSARVR